MQTPAKELTMKNANKDFDAPGGKGARRVAASSPASSTTSATVARAMRGFQRAKRDDDATARPRFVVVIDAYSSAILGI